MLLTGRVTRQRSSLVGGPEIQCPLSSNCMQMGSRLVTNHMEADAREMHGIYHMTEGPILMPNFRLEVLIHPQYNLLK